MVFLQSCTPLTPKQQLAHAANNMTLKLSVDFGSIEVAGHPSDSHFLFPSLTSLAHINQLLADTRYHVDVPSPDLISDSYKGPETDVLHIFVISGSFGSVIASTSLPILIFNRLVTFMTHTSGRKTHVQNMYESIQHWFPGTQLVASDDHMEGETQSLPAVPLGPQMRWIPVPLDCGLSFGRNTLLRAASTRFVQLLDDDFTLGPTSHLDRLLSILFKSKFHIASPVIFPTEKFRGLISTSDGDLNLEPGEHGAVEGCLHVDFVPNVFMGERLKLLDVGWDPELKLGEHEEFFLRAKEAGILVLSCDNIEVIHNQGKAMATAGAAYAERRKRVFDFFRQALRKHGLKRLLLFGGVVATVE